MTREFEHILQWGGTPQSQCSCGRVHYTAGGEFMDEGELESLEKRDKENPDRYIATSDDSVSFTVIFGKTYVFGCPCNWADLMEQRLWAARTAIISYYRARTAREMEEAKACAGALASLPNDIPSKGD